jgi:multimeric flavodoxin WrbA
MQLLAIYGSPRKKGNTDLMLDAFVEGALAAGGEVQKIYVRDMKLNGCLGCGHCDKEGVCIQKDDMTGLYPLLESAPRIAVASPIYFYGVTGQLKLLIDRSQACFMSQEVAKREGRELPPKESRRGFLLSAGATRGKRLFECAILTAKYFFDALHMDYAGELCFRELEERGAILQHPVMLETCRQAGKDFLAGH